MYIEETDGIPQEPILGNDATTPPFKGLLRRDLGIDGIPEETIVATPSKLSVESLAVIPPDAAVDAFIRALDAGKEGL